MGASLVVQVVMNLPAMWYTWVLFLDWEYTPEEGMATHSRILAWRITTEEPGGLQSMGSQRVRHDSVTKHTAHALQKQFFIATCGLDRSLHNFVWNVIAFWWILIWVKSSNFVIFLKVVLAALDPSISTWILDSVCRFLQKKKNAR